MKGLSKKQLARRDELVSALTDTRANLADELSSAHDYMQDAVDAVETVLADYNTAIGEALEFASDVGADIVGYMAARSDKWQASEKADDYANWADYWISAEIEEIHLEDVISFEVDDAPHEFAATLEMLPEEAG